MIQEKKECLISVIIPVYNAEKFLNKCLDSLHLERHKNMQVILINDGSKDYSKNICQMYRDRFPDSIIFIDKENAGVSAARNDGLERAEGEYVFFLDSDDYVSDNYYEEIELFLSSTDADLVIYGYQVFADNGKVTRESNTYTGNFEINSEFCDDIFDKLEYQAWNKLFRNNIIQKRKLRFNTSMKWSEDLDFWVRYIEDARKVSFLNKHLYFYRENMAGAVATVKKEALKSYKLAYSHQCEMLQKKKANSIAFQNIMKMYIEHVTLTLYNCYLRGDSVKQLKKVLKETDIDEDLIFGTSSSIIVIKKYLLIHNMINTLVLYFRLTNRIKSLKNRYLCVSGKIKYENN